MCARAVNKRITWWPWCTFRYIEYTARHYWKPTHIAITLFFVVFIIILSTPTPSAYITIIIMHVYAYHLRAYCTLLHLLRYKKKTSTLINSYHCHWQPPWMRRVKLYSNYIWLITIHNNIRIDLFLYFSSTYIILLTDAHIIHALRFHPQR